MQTVAIGLLGTTFDGPAKAANRWEKWRPSISLCQQEDLLISRFELLFPPAAAELAMTVVADIRNVSPETTVKLHSIDIPQPVGFREVFNAVFGFGPH